MIKIRRLNTLTLASLIVLCSLASLPSVAAIPIATDSRIKTFVFNENDIFPVTVHYGYMTSIEFAKNEDIITIAPGNTHSWKFIKNGRRLFIKALEGSARTNMTIITSKRTYQFEIESKNPDGALDEQVVYVVRFFYPGKHFDEPHKRINTSFVAPIRSSSRPQATTKKDFNFNYTLSGPDSISPIKIFDDGQNTFIQFANGNAVIPHFFIPGTTGSDERISYKRKGDYIQVSQISPQIILRLGQDQVTIYNESLQP